MASMTMTPPKSNAGTPQRPVESEDISLSSPTKVTSPKKEKGNDEDSSTDEDEQLEDDLLSPVSSAGSDLEKAAMERELEEQGLIRKPKDEALKQSRSSEKSGGTPSKAKSKGNKKDQSLPESEIVARWNREIGDVCVVGVKA